MNDDFSTGSMRPSHRWPGPLKLALAGVALALAAVLWLWFSLAAMQQQVDARLADVVARENSLASSNIQLGDALNTLSSGHAGVSRRVDSLYGTHRTGLQAGEAEHLVRLAAQRLALMQDPAGALALLTAADAALRDIRGADVHAARAALARDIQQLRELAALDVEAAWLRLAALPDLVDQLAAAEPVRPGRAPVAAVVADPAPDSAWERFRRAVFSLVSVRRVDQPVAPIITADERALAGQNFRLLIEQAQLALLQRRAGIYRQSLQRAEQWLDRIAAGDPVRRGRVRQELANLGALTVNQPLPDLSASLAATRALATRVLPETDGGAGLPAAPAPAGATP